MFEQYALIPIEKALNLYIQLDPLIPPRVSALEGKTLGIYFSGLMPLKCYLQFHQAQIHLLADYPGTPDALVTGTPLQIAKLACMKENSHHILRDHSVNIEGDVLFTQEVKKLFDEIEIDWEEHLSYIFGDIIAHQIGNVCRSTNIWRASFLDSMNLNIREYLHEEVNLLPSQEELEDFFTDIDMLRMDVDRFSAQVSRLQRRLAK